jgi:glycosyltransferase involved in cell wall biosynthesis
MSSRFEGFGLVLIEAMECGLPVVAFDCESGPAEIIKDGFNGLLVRNSDISALASSMKKLMNNEELRISMGHNAVCKAGDYAMDNIMEKWRNLYRILLRK